MENDGTRMAVVFLLMKHEMVKISPTEGLDVAYHNVGPGHATRIAPGQFVITTKYTTLDVYWDDKRRSAINGRVCADIAFSGGWLSSTKNQKFFVVTAKSK